MDTLKEKKLMPFILILVIFLIFVIYIALHSTPLLAMRTAIFTRGHPIIALTTEFKDMGIADPKHGDFYSFSGWDSHATGDPVTSIVVKKVLFLYEAEITNP